MCVFVSVCIGVGVCVCIGVGVCVLGQVGTHPRGNLLFEISRNPYKLSEISYD